MKKWILAATNVLVLVLGILLTVVYTTNLAADRAENARSAFTDTVDSMKQISIGYLEAQQEHVDNWAQYINENDLTLNQTIDFLRQVNSNSDISVQIIDPDTMIGISTRANVTSPSDYSVEYKGTESGFKENVAAIASQEDTSTQLHIVSSFTNQIDGLDVIAIGSVIHLKNEQTDYVMLRIVPLTEIQQQWVFPVGYEDAEIGLVSMDGTYIVRSKSMKGDDFYDYLRSYNGMTYPQKDAMIADMKENGSGLLEYLDSKEIEAYWAYTSIDNGADGCFLIGYIPCSSLKGSANDWTLVWIVGGMLLLLFIIDGQYILALNDKLKKSAAEANSANAAKTQFLSSMSHDIRTPMNAIVGMTTVAMRNLDDRDRVKDCLQKVTLASNHLLTLINDILDISKVESGQFSLNPTVFSLPEIMTNLTNIVRPQIHTKSLDFKIHMLHMQYEYLYADELRLNQIFINLLSNAVKYTPINGRIILTLEEQEMADNPKMVHLIYTVEDTGIGMSEEFMQSMFEPFKREKDTRIDAIEGTGLGLAITKRMVDAMGGNITVQSKQGVGSTFTVTLDLPIADKLTDDLMLPPIDVLVVDDDEIFLESTADTLQSIGVTPYTVNNGTEAVSMAVSRAEQGKGYPIIIIDWKMPQMNGVETIRQIRAKVGREVSILILSAFDWAEIEEEAIAAGADGFINKPVFRSSLYTKIDEMLHLHTDIADTGKERTYEEFKGMHLLIAEDNDMNWEIIESLLGFYEITADWAKNGAICVQMLTEAPPNTYAAVLMDVQMPVMNGKEATRAIRASTIPYVNSIPIIAMTADAFAEDVKACLDVGMDAHVAKPVDMKQLLEKLEKIQKGEQK